MTGIDRVGVGAVLITYNRPAELGISARAVAAQTHRISALVVVDNGASSRVTEEVLSSIDWGTTRVSLVHAPENIGPAGGFAEGCRRLDLEDSVDWVLLLDDDDPLPSDDVLAELLALGLEIKGRDSRFGGIALKGAAFNPRTLRTLRIELSDADVVRADHLHGGYAPLYDRTALRDVGEADGKLFWGFEELDLGLRLTRRGWNLYMAPRLMRSYPLPAKYRELSSRPRWRVAEPSTGAYYKLRNLTYIGWRHAPPAYVVFALFLRAICKPLVNLPFRPRAGGRQLAMNVKAMFDGTVGRMGRRY